LSPAVTELQRGQPRVQRAGGTQIRIVAHRHDAPASITTMRCALSTVARRCAITTVSCGTSGRMLAAALSARA
jgi:hypothetical protein